LERLAGGGKGPLSARSIFAPSLRAELVRRGYSSVDIAKILGGNWMRVFREAWNS